MTTETKEAVFDCPKLRGPAAVTWEETVHYSSRNGLKIEDKRVRGGFVCNSAEDCGVQDDRGNYDWEKCVCPKSRK